MTVTYHQWRQPLGPSFRVCFTCLQTCAKTLLEYVQTIFLESVCTYVQSLHSDASVLHYTYNSLDAIFSLIELPSLYISLVNYKPRQVV